MYISYTIRKKVNTRPKLIHAKLLSKKHFYNTNAKVQTRFKLLKLAVTTHCFEHKATTADRQCGRRGPDGSVCPGTPRTHAREPLDGPLFSGQAAGALCTVEQALIMLALVCVLLQGLSPACHRQLQRSAKVTVLPPTKQSRWPHTH